MNETASIQVEPRDELRESLRLWDRLSGVSERERNELFERIAAAIEPFLLRYLKSKTFDGELADQLANEARLRLWRASFKFRPSSSGAWLSYVKKTADSCLFNHFRDRQNDPNRLEPPEDIPDGDVPYIDLLVERALDWERLQQLANELWLGPTPNKSRLLALQLRYEHGTPWEEVAGLMENLGVEGIDEFLVEPTLARWLAYSKLYLDRDRLAAYLLSPTCPPNRSDLDALSQQARENAGKSSCSDWNWEEVRVIFWRIRNGLLVEQIKRLAGCPFSDKELLAVLSRITQAFPFKSRMTKVLGVCRAARLKPTVLAHEGLWKRLVFQYHIADELAQKDILERVGPCAALAEKKVTAGMLNVWISNGRLFAQLIAFARGPDEA